MKFSILVPVYNVERYLTECLESIEQQQYRDFEVVLVDDGSTDGSGRLCDEYAQEHRNAIVVHKPNGGLLSARRTGIQNAKGEYYLFLDSDDMLETHALQTLATIIDRENPEMILFNAYVYENGTKSPFSPEVFAEGRVCDKNLIYDQYLTSYTLNSICLKVVKKEIVDRERDYSAFYGCNYGEDLLQSVPLTINAERIYYTTKKLYDYRYESGMMRRYNSKYYWSYKQVNGEVRRLLEQVGISEVELKSAYHLIIAAYGAATQYRYKPDRDWSDLREISSDYDFRNAYSLVVNGDWREKLSLKHRVILGALYHRCYWGLGILLTLKR